MRTKAMAAGLFAVLVSVFGCARHDGIGEASASEIQARSNHTAVHSFAFGAGGVTAQSRVEHSVRHDGVEVLRGSTEVRLPGEAHALVLRESAELDATGRMITATSELRSGVRAQDLVRVVEMDAAHGTVSVRDAKGEATFLVSADHPWFYVSPFADIAPAAGDATAVQAWVARRAAQAEAASLRGTDKLSRVRGIDVGARGSWVTLANQVLLDDAPSAWVVLGDEAIETDGEFVRALPFRGLESAAAAEQKASFDCAPGPV